MSFFFIRYRGIRELGCHPTMSTARSSSSGLPSGAEIRDMTQKTLLRAVGVDAASGHDMPQQNRAQASKARGHSEVKSPAALLRADFRHQRHEMSRFLSSADFQDRHHRHKMAGVAELPAQPDNAGPKAGADALGPSPNKAFHSVASIKQVMHEKGMLDSIRRFGVLRRTMALLNAALAMTGLIIATAISEVCSFGYLPSDLELSEEGLSDPYVATSSAGCQQDHEQLYASQGVICLLSAVLAVSVGARAVITLKEKELQVLYIASQSDPPDIDIINHSARTRRARICYCYVSVEILLTVLVFPFPGWRKTFVVQALEREAKYELESIMVMQWQIMHMYTHIRPGNSVTNVADFFQAILMFGRLWHVWVLVRNNLWLRKFEEATYLLGNRTRVLELMKSW